MACGKNLGDMFFNVFQHAEQESEVKSQKKWLFAEISDLLSLFVRDCTTKFCITTCKEENDQQPTASTQQTSAKRMTVNAQQGQQQQPRPEQQPAATSGKIEWPRQDI